MMTLIERAIDTSILLYKTTAAEQSIAQGNPEATGLPVGITLVAPQNELNRMPEQQENSINQDLLIPMLSLPTVYNSLDSSPDSRPISSNPTLGTDSTTSVANPFDRPANEATPSIQHNNGNNLSRTSDHGEATISISTSSKGKQKAIYPENDANEYQDFHAYHELQFGHLNPQLASQDGEFSQSNVQLDMNTDATFEDFYLDSGLEPDWNWLTEASQRLV
jgi:hypothetical protein